VLFLMQAAPPPVSFSREVAVIFAMHCNSCHGEAGRLSLRSYEDMMRGGSLGPVVIPGDPDKSLLLEFIDGRRGEARRMPQNGRPLTAAQTETIRRWIAEGARDDGLRAPDFQLIRENVPMRREKPTRIFCRLHTRAYLAVSARDPRDGLVLWSEVASVKDPKDPSDAAKPGELIEWDVRAGSGWPAKVTLELSIYYAEHNPRDSQFYYRAPD
jgi:hypothetical protein